MAGDLKSYLTKYNNLAQENNVWHYSVQNEMIYLHPSHVFVYDWVRQQSHTFMTGVYYGIYKKS